MRDESAKRKYWKEYHERNREKHLAQMKDFRLRTYVPHPRTVLTEDEKRKRARERSAMYRAKHPETVRAKLREWEKKNRNARSKYRMKQHYLHHERSCELNRNWRHSHKDQLNEYYRNRRNADLPRARIREIDQRDRRDPLRIAYREVIQTRHAIEACKEKLQRRTA
jgi:hypothetical protein